MEEYRTVEMSADDFFIEKKSKFIGYAKPVKTVEEATEFISQIRSKHWDATHNVYAYVLRENNTQRYSDDGEPGGTAVFIEKVIFTLSAKSLSLIFAEKSDKSIFILS